MHVWDRIEAPRAAFLVAACTAILGSGGVACERINLIGEVRDGAIRGQTDGETITIGPDAPSDRPAATDAVDVATGSPDAGVDLVPPAPDASTVNPDASTVILDASPDFFNGSVYVPGVDAGPARSAGASGCSITYPPDGFYGSNIFYADTPLVHAGNQSNYTMAADVPAGASLTFRMTLLSDANLPVGMTAAWYFSESDFRATVYDATTNEQLFMSRLPGRNEMSIFFQGTGSARIDFYECSSANPTRVEIVSWAP